MPDSEKLRDTLDLLHEQLADAEGDIDADVAAKLLETTGDIAMVLDRQSGAEHEPTSIAERLREAARHFEVSHPTLSGTIGQLADILAQMGI